MRQKKGKSTVGIGLQYGDEGKIKIFDKVAGDADIWVRFNGGPNAGHHLAAAGKHIVTHGVPSGIFHPEAILYVGSGCVVNPQKFLKEVEEVKSLGVSLEDRLWISAKTSLIQPHHIVLDNLKGKEVGTTGNGIGPAYADQALRQLGTQLRNIRLGDFAANPSACTESARQNLAQIVEQNQTDVNSKQLLADFRMAAEQLAHYLCRDPLFLEKLVQQGRNPFFEGANAVMLDACTGDVPFVTSSRTLAAAAYTGGDLSIRHHHKTMGVAKAIVSRVGNGPFIAEFGGEHSEAYCREEGGFKYVREVEERLYDAQTLLQSDDPLEIGIGLRMLGGEYGATTKRPRRIGMLDLVMLRQNCLLNGVDELYINKFDCLNQFANSSLPGIPLVVAYELENKRIDYMPNTVAESRRTQPVVEYMPAFTQDISTAKTIRDLPLEALDLIARIEEEVGVPISGIGVGSEREQYVQLRS